MKSGLILCSTIILACIIIATVRPAMALNAVFVPPSQEQVCGQPVTVEVTIAGLASDFGAPADDAYLLRLVEDDILSDDLLCLIGGKYSVDVVAGDAISFRIQFTVKCNGACSTLDCLGADWLDVKINNELNWKRQTEWKGPGDTVGIIDNDKTKPGEYDVEVWSDTDDSVDWELEMEFYLSSTNYGRGDIYCVEHEGVGGAVIPTDKFGLLAPYVGLASTAMIGAVATVVYVKLVKRRKEKQ